MLFSSLVFLFLFLPATLALYYVFYLPSLRAGSAAARWRRLSNLVLLLMSLLFYAWGEKGLVALMVGTSLLHYLAGLFIGGGFRPEGPLLLAPGGARTAGQKAALAAAIAGTLGLLGFYKYFNFIGDNLRLLMGTLGLSGVVWSEAVRITLPLGISFYTFQSLSYTIDVYRGRAKATRSFIDFACYVAMFPQLVAGPIVRYIDVAAQLVQRSMSLALFASGAGRFIVGLAKKVLVANTVAAAADRVFGLPTGEIDAGLAWLGVLCYTIQIYFDFSGYSDMAIGLGRMLGFEFPENFRHPYASRSNQEFWRRWHISLSTWFRDYLYIPLGGSRFSAARTYLNLVTVFFLCGLWHGASWTFVVWGLYHGFFLVLERLGLAAALSRSWRPVQHLYCLLVAMGGWVLFRAESFAQAVAFFRAMAGFGGVPDAGHGWRFLLEADVALALAAGALLAFPVVPWCRGRLAACLEGRTGPWRLALEAAAGAARLVVLGGLLLLSCLSLSSGTYNPFIYFRF